MKKQRIKGIVLVVVCFICVLCICSGFYRVQSKELSEIPDAVNSTRFNTGLPVEEHRKALEINMLDGYAEFTTGK